MRKVVRVYQEWIAMEDKPVFMKDPDHGPYPTTNSLDRDHDDQVRNHASTHRTRPSKTSPLQTHTSIVGAVTTVYTEGCYHLL